MLKTNDLFDFNHSISGTYLSGFEYPWQALSGISSLILILGPQLGSEYQEVSAQVWVHKTAKVAENAAAFDGVEDVKFYKDTVDKLLEAFGI